MAPRSEDGRPARISCGLVVFLFMVSVVAGLAFWLLSKGPGAPFIAPLTGLSATDARATAESYTFATAQANRQATRESVSATNTALDQASVTAHTQSTATALAFANSTATTSAKATAEAPPTLTAIARRHLEDEAQAAATVQTVELSAPIAFGPSGGVLDHNSGDTSSCYDTGLKLENFIAQARFYNPYPPAEHGWDYGILLANSSDTDHSQYEIALDSGEYLSLRLSAPGYYIQVQDIAFDHLDLSNSGSNLLKLYVLGDQVHVYINNRFSATLDLRSVDLNNDIVAGPRDIRICTGLKDGDLKPGASTRYEALTIWKVP